MRCQDGLWSVEVDVGSAALPPLKRNTALIPASKSAQPLTVTKMTAEDIREMSFQNVLDTILKPAGVKVGGYPEEIFVDLNEEEREKWNCNICYLVVREARECANKHLFCHTCVFAWSLTYGENSQKCPMCRVDQRTYLPNKEVNKLIGDKRIKCPHDDCTFRSPLHIFLMHSHGKALYANHNVDLESLRPARAAHGHNLIILPGGVAFTGDMLGGTQRASNIREQLQQGRAMIHQMMVLLHLEMQLRQQALVGYSQAQDPNTRLRRLDEVLALNEQLNEVGTILSALLSTPLAARGGGRIIQPIPPAGPRRIDISRDVIMSRGGIGRGTPTLDGLLSRAGPSMSAHGSPLGLAGGMGRVGMDEDEDDDNSSDTSDATSISSVPSVVPRLRMSMTGTLHSPRDGATGPTVTPPHRVELQRPQRRNEIRTQLLSLGSTNEARSSPATPRLIHRDQNVSTRRVIGDSATHDNNNSVLVSLQRLDSNNSTSTSTTHSDNNTSPRDQSTTLPPLPTSVGNTARNLQGRQSAVNASNNDDLLLRSRLPIGSSAHQQIMSSLSSREDDTDDLSDSQSNGLTMQRANSVARHRPFMITPGVDGLRGPRVTAEGVTASGAIFSTSADTPSTRAAATRPPPSSTAASEGVTPSGAVYSTSADTPSTRAASLQVTNRDSEARVSSASSSSATSAPSPSQTSSTQAADPIMGSGANTNSSNVTAHGRSQVTNYASQRRFRQEASLARQQGAGAASGNRRSGATGNDPLRRVPYVPHRSGSPGRVAFRERGTRTQSLSVDNQRRLSFSTATRARDGNDSITQRPARGGVGVNRASLPTTPGQLLRIRRNSQSQNRRTSGPRNGPGGTI